MAGDPEKLAVDSAWVGRNFPENRFVQVSRARRKPAISILMPVFEQAGFVAEAISSILRQEAVTAEIIISDDASGDGTFAAALACILEAARAGELPHKVLMRRGRQRLWRDHLHLLIERAECDLLCQAHGDDVSHPHRAAAIVLCAQHYPASAMFVSRFVKTTAATTETHQFPALKFPLGTSQLSITKALRQSAVSVGSGLAWRRSALVPFGRLDTKSAPMSHDRIMTFRAALAGGVTVIDTPLYFRRRHDGSATTRLFSAQGGLLRTRLAALVREGVMLADAHKAHALGLIPDGVRDEVARELVASRMSELDAFLDLYGSQVALGLDLTWTDPTPPAAGR